MSEEMPSLVGSRAASATPAASTEATMVPYQVSALAPLLTAATSARMPA